MVPSSYARLGFPSVKEVDLQQRDKSEEGNSGQQTGSKGNEKKKKKSLFAQQFGEMPLSVFGIVDEREGVSSIWAMVLYLSIFEELNYNGWGSLVS